MTPAHRTPPRANGTPDRSKKTNVPFARKSGGSNEIGLSARDKRQNRRGEVVGPVAVDAVPAADCTHLTVGK